MPLTGSATEPLQLWLEPGPELVDVLAGEGMLGMGDGLSVTLKERSKKSYLCAAPITSWCNTPQTVNATQLKDSL